MTTYTHTHLCVRHNRRNYRMVWEPSGDQIRQNEVSEWGGGLGKDPEGRYSWAIVLIEPSKQKLWSKVFQAEYYQHRLRHGGHQQLPKPFVKAKVGIWQSGGQWRQEVLSVISPRPCNEEGGLKIENWTRTPKAVVFLAVLRYILMIWYSTQIHSASARN